MPSRRVTSAFLLFCLVTSMVLAACDDNTQPAKNATPAVATSTAVADNIKPNNTSIPEATAPVPELHSPTPEPPTADPPTPTAQTVGEPGCPSAQLTNSPPDGLSDALFPTLGNAGYNVQHYALDISVDVDNNVISGTATLDVRALKDLAAFNLDLTGLEIGSLEVNSQDATYKRTGSELTITPRTPIGSGQSFTVKVRYGGQPASATMPGSPTQGWQNITGGTLVAGEPEGASTWYPVNEHPCDKATYTLRITVPKPYVVAATGHEVNVTDNGGTSTYLTEMRDPAASYLVTINIGRYDKVTQQGPDGLEIRHYFPKDLSDSIRALFDSTPEMIEFLSSKFGPYPFEVYGGIVVDTDLGFALETQTMSMFGTDLGTRNATSEETLLHELAHQWFGDAVSLQQWKDVWLNEGFATYAQWLWLEHKEGRAAYDERIIAMHRLVQDAGGIAPGKPDADTLFNPGVYLRGGLTLHALRMKVGDNVFFRTLKTYFATYKYGNASTADFIAVAEKESGQDLSELFNSWLYADKIPALPAENQGGGGGRAAATLPQLAQGWTKTKPGGDTACARGTAYSFWVRPGKVNKLLLYFEGGGGCWDARSCAPGSKFFNDATGDYDNPASLDGVFDLSNASNPFKDYYMVFVPYCTGDVHMGNNIKTYKADDGTELTIYHKGYVNSSAAVDWAYDHFDGPEQVFVAGCSAGSIGSIVFAPRVIQHYPSSQVLQLGDSEAFVFDHPVDLESTYKAHENFPNWIPGVEAIQPGRFTMSTFYSAIAAFYPNNSFAQYNTGHDFVQQGFYIANLRPQGTPVPWESALQSSLAEIHSASPNFHSYTSAGNEHCITPTDRFYTEQVGGVAFRDWVSDMANGNTPGDIKP